MSNEGPQIPSSEIIRSGVRGSLRWLSEVSRHQGTIKYTVIAIGVLLGQHIAARFSETPSDAMVVGTVAGFIIGAAVGEVAERIRRKGILS